jgi:hypothetical protein
MNTLEKEFKVGTILPEHEVYAFIQSIHHEEEDFSDGDIGERIEAYESYEVKEVPLSEIEKPWTYIDEDMVDDYLGKAMETVPPILLGYYSDGTYQTIDGGHRVTVALKRNQTTIKAFVAIDTNRSKDL